MSRSMRSIRVRPELVQRVKLSVKGNGFFRQKDLVEAVGLADSTVRNFLGGKPVDYATFVEICQKLNLEWKDFADLPEGTKFDQELEAAVTASETELSSKAIVLDQSQPSYPLPDKQEKTLEASHKLEAISFLEYFPKAIDQLKSKELDVRIGAISTLGTLSEYSPPAEHWKIMEYLAAFIRTNAPRKEEGEEERSPKLPEDIQAALTVIGGRNPEKDPANKTLNLSNTNLAGVELSQLNFEQVNFTRAKLKGANLSRASLKGVNFKEANLEGVNLNGADMESANLFKTVLSKANLRGVYLKKAILIKTDLSFAYLERASLEGAILHEANLKQANLSGANLSESYFNNANLEGVKLTSVKSVSVAKRNQIKVTEVNMEGAVLCGAKLKGANFSKAKNLDLGQLSLANGDSTTVLPDYVEAPSHWM